MIGAIIVAVIIVVVIPVGFLMSTAVAAGALGALLRANAEAEHADSELLETNY
ncbi:MAG: hypothetical protein ACFCVK_16935 [Acidimicrobiales bacterium]